MSFGWFGGFANLRSLHSRIGDTSGRSSRSVLCLNITVGRTMIVAFLDIIILSAQASHLNDNIDDGTASLLPVYERGFA